jgi:hypothetical protein
VNGDALALTLPSRAEHLGTARSFVAAVARHFSVAGEAVEDLKLAVSEACVDALSAGTPILVRAEEAGGSIAFSVDAPESDGDADGTGADELGALGRLELIRALFPDAAVVQVDGRRAIRFSVPYA